MSSEFVEKLKATSNKKFEDWLKKYGEEFEEDCLSAAKNGGFHHGYIFLSKVKYLIHFDGLAKFVKEKYGFSSVIFKYEEVDNDDLECLLIVEWN